MRFLKFHATEAFEILKFAPPAPFKFSRERLPLNLRQIYKLTLAVFENGDLIVAELARFGINFIVV